LTLFHNPEFAEVILVPLGRSNCLR